MAMNFASSKSISGNRITTGMPCVLDEPAGGGDPAGVAPHHLEHEHLGRGLRHRTHVEAASQRRHRDVLRHRAEAGAAVGDRQVVVDRLRHVDRLDRIAHRLRQLAHLEAGVGRIAAAVVEEVADVVRSEHLDQPLVLAPVRVERLQLVAARAERARRRVRSAWIADERFLAGVDQVFGQRADDAVAAGIDLADGRCARARSGSRRTATGVDDGGDAAGLRVEGILLRSGHAVTSFQASARVTISCTSSDRSARAATELIASRAALR